jgi:hypothetical protein
VFRIKSALIAVADALALRGCLAGAWETAHSPEGDIILWLQVHQLSTIHDQNLARHASCVWRLTVRLATWPWTLGNEAGPDPRFLLTASEYLYLTITV